MENQPISGQIECHTQENLKGWQDLFVNPFRRRGHHPPDAAPQRVVSIPLEGTVSRCAPDIAATSPSIPAVPSATDAPSDSSVESAAIRVLARSACPVR